MENLIVDSNVKIITSKANSIFEGFEGTLLNLEKGLAEVLVKGNHGGLFTIKLPEGDVEAI